MRLNRPLRPMWLALALALMLAAPSTSALAAEASGSGVAVHGSATTAVLVELRDGQPLVFSYLDYATDPPRTLSFSEAPTVDCLGELFGGQAIRLSGPGIDSGTPGEALTLQVFLIDGGDQAPDRLSLKASRADGSVIYFAPLRDLQSGSLVLGC